MSTGGDFIQIHFRLHFRSIIQDFRSPLTWVVRLKKKEPNRLHVSFFMKSIRPCELVNLPASAGVLEQQLIHAGEF